MSHEKHITLPRVGDGEQRCRIVAWHKAPGDSFASGEVLLEVETDKAMVEIPAREVGELVEQLAAVDDQVAHREPIARIRVANDPQDATAQRKSPPVSQRSARPESHRATASTNDPPSQRRVATPFARKLAHQHGISLASLSGSGKRGRIVAADVRAAVDAGATRRQSGRGTIADSWRAQADRARDSAGYRFEEDDLTFDGVRLHRRQWIPEAPVCDRPIVLLHGLFGDGDLWLATADTLARQGWPVAALDLPLHGRSTSDALRLERLVELIARALAQAHPQMSLLVGHSFGALVATRALAAASADGPQVSAEALALLAPLGIGTTIDQAFLDGLCHARSIEALRRELAKLSASGETPSTSYLERLLVQLGERSAALADLCAQVANRGTQQVDIVSELAALTLPVKIIHGRSDRVIPFEQMLAAPAQVALHLVPGAGHMPQWDASNLVQTLLLQLLES